MHNRFAVTCRFCAECGCFFCITMIKSLYHYLYANDLLCIIATLQLRALVMAMQIGDLIRMKREEHGLTQEQLAELIGKSAGYIGQLERGLSMASIPTLKRLVNVLSLDANQIFYDEKQDQYQFSELENMLSELDEPVQKFIQDSIRTAFHKKHS